ncbi:type VI secretion system tip protein VgrG [Paraburkholderia sp. 31.1]|uniref:type VI secretion system Vgr family protein n=1 Tax=Paraburkholderia sp. 31.1 TaxID=2615205 RepID=UPI00165640AD|nr:type VI secretion system Vgr family protein [Paraburkholderia sp. 31.1]MBC8721223.1 type VI secretion system tip protein VgrG [Paraburkholderia sp. 31.1]
MAESDRITKYLTGRQSAHLKFMPRKPQKVDRETGKPKPMPLASVVSWEVHEEICEPYCIKAVITTTEPVSRKKVLGQFAEFSIQPEDGRGLRRFSGFVSRYDLVSESRDGCTYHVVVRQRLAMLDGPSNCVTYQRMASWEIIKAILERHDIRFWMQVEFRLRREHPRHDFRFQYNMGDWAYIRLEMEQAGLFCFTKTGEHGEVLVIADDIDGYERPHVTVRDRPTAGLSTFEESIFTFRVHTRTVPESFVVADYNPESAWEILRNEREPAWDDPTMIGQPYVWGTHHGDAEGAKRDAQLRHEAALAQQVRYKVKSTVLELRPGCLVRSDRALEDTKSGMVVTKVVHSGARDASYMNRFTAIPADRPYRMVIDESRWPRIHGTLGATICSPDKYKFAYLTDKGEYIARFHCDFGQWPKGAESVPLRLAKPFSGKNNTGMHMPALDGDEALVGFREGNPNKPILVGFMPNSQRPDLINSSRRRMSRNEIRTQSGNKLWMDDWDNQQGIELSTEHSGRSQLNLGFIPDGELKERGAGAELRTAGHAVTRGGAGVMVTAYNQAGGSGKVLAMDETDAQLTDHQVFARSLADAVTASKASPADMDAQQAIYDGLKELKKPGVLVTGPGPAGVVSGGGMHLAADGPIIGTAKKGVHFSTLRRITAAAGDVLSMFAQKGMSLITSAGDFVAQAQRGRMQLASQEDMSFESVNGVVHVKAAKEIILNVNGTYVKISGGGVEIGSRGGVLFRTAGVKGSGPAQMDLGGAAFAPAFVPYTTACEVWRTNPAFVPPPAPAPEMDTAENMVAPAPDAGGVAPSPLGDFFSRKSSDALPPGASAYSPFDGKPSNVDSGIPKAKTTLNSPDDQPKAPVAPDPIKLVNAVPCDWKSTDLKADVEQHIEAKSYLGMLDNRTPWMSDDKTTQYRGGGSRDSNFEFAYSEQDKAITCTVRVMLIPMDLFPVDGTGKRDLTADDQTIPYNFSAHSTMTLGSIRKGVKMDYRDSVGDKYDLIALKSRIEAVLNQGGYKLILDGCSKGAACGCRVKVNFKVDFRLSIRGAPVSGFKEHVSLHLYPSVLRADTSSWGEQHKWQDQNQVIHDYPIANVEAHECGHYFNFPDEYYDQGGWLHETYIKDGRIDFSLVDAKAGTLAWQGRSQTNLMGYGANLPLQKGRATIKPYYLEYVRRQYSLATNKLWRVGYEP